MSGVLNKLWTALRGAANEAGEAAVDVNATRISIRRFAMLTRSCAMPGRTGRHDGQADRGAYHLPKSRRSSRSTPAISRQTLAKQKAAESAGQTAEVAEA